jgi:hypothetical protein
MLPSKKLNQRVKGVNADEIRSAEELIMVLIILLEHLNLSLQSVW